MAPATAVTLDVVGARLAPERDRHTEPGDLVDLGQRLGQLVAVPLGHAAGDDEPRAVAALSVEGEDRVDRLLARASSMNAHVLTTTRSAAPGSSVASIPSASNVPISLSESTWFFGTAERLDVEALRHIDPGYRAHPPNCLLQTQRGAV